MSAVIIYKNVDVITDKQLRNLSKPIYSSVFSIRLSLEDILSCILEKATVLEILSADKRLKLTLSNYKKDNTTGEDPIPDPYNGKPDSFPFISGILDAKDSPGLVTGNAIKTYIANNGGGGGGTVTLVDGKVFTDKTGATIKFRRGAKADLPTLAVGEPAVVNDEKRLYVGGATGVIAIPNQADIAALQELIDGITVDVNIENKVDKVAGKGLSTNDYATQDKNAVATIGNKVDKVAGKGLSANDYTIDDKNAVATIGNKADGSAITDLNSQLNYIRTQIASILIIIGGIPSTPFTASLVANVSIAEAGTIINSIIFTWSYAGGVPTSQQFEGTTLDNALRTKTYTTPVSTNKTFTLSAVAPDSSVKTSTASIKFFNGIYYGVSSSVSYDNTLVKSLTKVLSDIKGRTINVNAAGETDYIYYCIPSRLGAITFTVGGFEGGLGLVSTIQFTNANGFTESYDIYRSDNAGLGSTTINIA